MVEDEAVVPPAPLIRLATDRDLETVEKNREKEKKPSPSARRRSPPTGWR